MLHPALNTDFPDVGDVVSEIYEFGDNWFGQIRWSMYALSSYLGFLGSIAREETALKLYLEGSGYNFATISCSGKATWQHR